MYFFLLPLTSNMQPKLNSYSSSLRVWSGCITWGEDVCIFHTRTVWRQIRLHVSRQSVREPQAARWHTKTGAPFSSNGSQPRWVTEKLALLETSMSAIRFLAARAERIIRELVGIRGLSNPNLLIDSTIISLVFKSDYMLQLKEASAGSFMGTTKASRGQMVWRFREKALFMEHRGLHTILVVAVEWFSHEHMLNVGGDA